MNEEVVNILFSIALVISFIIAGKFFCGKIKKRNLIASVIEDKCKNCGYCVHICRHHVLESTVINDKKLTFVNHPERCRGCGKCAVNCPEKAIKMVEICSKN